MSCQLNQSDHTEGMLLDLLLQLRVIGPHLQAMPAADGSSSVPPHFMHQAKKVIATPTSIVPIYMVTGTHVGISGTSYPGSSCMRTIGSAMTVARNMAKNVGATGKPTAMLGSQG